MRAKPQRCEKIVKELARCLGHSPCPICERYFRDDPDDLEMPCALADHVEAFEAIQVTRQECPLKGILAHIVKDGLDIPRRAVVKMARHALDEFSENNPEGTDHEERDSHPFGGTL